jgi:hypothetical protein
LPQTSGRWTIFRCRLQLWSWQLNESHCACTLHCTHQTITCTFPSISKETERDIAMTLIKTISLLSTASTVHLLSAANWKICHTDPTKIYQSLEAACLRLCGRLIENVPQDRCMVTSMQCVYKLMNHSQTINHSLYGINNSARLSSSIRRSLVFIT